MIFVLINRTRNTNIDLLMIYNYSQEQLKRKYKINKVHLIYYKQVKNLKIIKVLLTCNSTYLANYICNLRNTVWCK